MGRFYERWAAKQVFPASDFAPLAIEVADAIYSLPKGSPERVSLQQFLRTISLIRDAQRSLGDLSGLVVDALQCRLELREIMNVVEATCSRHEASQSRDEISSDTKKRIENLYAKPGESASDVVRCVTKRFADVLDVPSL